MHEHTAGAGASGGCVGLPGVREKTHVHWWYDTVFGFVVSARLGYVTAVHLFVRLAWHPPGLIDLSNLLVWSFGGARSTRKSDSA